MPIENDGFKNLGSTPTPFLHKPAHIFCAKAINGAVIMPSNSWHQPTRVIEKTLCPITLLGGSHQVSTAQFQYSLGAPVITVVNSVMIRGMGLGSWPHGLQEILRP